MVNLGNMYFDGDGVAQNYMLAERWYEKAVNLSHDTTLMIKIGDMFKDGLGIARNINKAWSWYELAATMGDQNAMRIIARREKLTNWVKQCRETCKSGFDRCLDLVIQQGSDIYKGEGCLEANDACYKICRSRAAQLPSWLR